MMWLKRLQDAFFAFVILVITAPVQVIVAVAVATTLGRPVLFHQLRAGQDGSTFRLMKFRSMRPQPTKGSPLSDEERVTTAGRIIRRFRLDELPQLLLILLGHMALVGPRPLYPSGHGAENDLLFRFRHRVRPGMTGWAQVNGNTLLSEREKLALDAVYVAKVSPLFDVRILWQTLVTILRGERRDEANIQKALILADSLDRRG